MQSIQNDPLFFNVNLPYGRKHCYRVVLVSAAESCSCRCNVSCTLLQVLSEVVVPLSELLTVGEQDKRTLPHKQLRLSKSSPLHSQSLYIIFPRFTLLAHFCIIRT